MRGYYKHRRWQRRKSHHLSGIEVYEYVGWHADQAKRKANLLGWIVRRHTTYLAGWAWYVNPTYGFAHGTHGFCGHNTAQDFHAARSAVEQLIQKRLSMTRRAITQAEAEGTTA